MAILHQFTLITESLIALRAHPEGVYKPDNLLAVQEAATRAVEGTFLDEELKQIHLQHFEEFFLQHLKNRKKLFWTFLLLSLDSDKLQKRTASHFKP